MESDVHVTLCDKYDLDKIRSQVSEHLDRYSVFKDLKDKRILLKMNLLSASDPKLAITTHPVFMKAVILEIQRRGGEVLIGDSPGGLFNAASLSKAYEVSGIKKVAEETGADLNFQTTSTEEHYLKGKFLKRFNISDYIRSSDLIIAIPKIKTHMFCGLTCASKIMFGAVPGTEKVKYHTRFPETVDFSKMLMDVTDHCKVDLFLVDGIIGMEGRGPARGNPREVGAILSGKEPRVIDLQVTRMSGLDPKMLPVMIAAKDLGYIEYGQRIDVSGNGKDHKLEKPFQPAQGGGIFTHPPRLISRVMINIANDKPYISYKKCIGCGICKENCAGDAIEMKEGKAYIDYSKCSRCYCCHELCPHDSIYLSMRESGFANWLGDFAYRRYATTKKK